MDKAEIRIINEETGEVERHEVVELTDEVMEMLEKGLDPFQD